MLVYNIKNHIIQTVRKLNNLISRIKKKYEYYKGKKRFLFIPSVILKNYSFEFSIVDLKDVS